MYRRLGEILQQKGLVPEQTLRRALEKQSAEKGVRRIGEILMEEGLLLTIQNF